MKMLTLLGAIATTLLTGCNPQTRVLNVVRKNAVVTSNNDSLTISYQVDDIGMFNVDSNIPALSYQYHLFGDNYIYNSQLFADDTNSTRAILKQNVFNQNNWKFGFLDYSYYDDSSRSGADDYYFYRLYFTRKAYTTYYYVEDSLFRYFYDNNVATDFVVYLPSFLNIYSLFNFVDFFPSSTSVDSTSLVYYWGTNQDINIDYLVSTNTDTLHNIEDDDYPYFSSGYNYFEDSNVALMSNIFSFVLSGETLHSLFHHQGYSQNLNLSFVANALTYEEGYQKGYAVGTDEGYTDGYSDGANTTNAKSYDEGYQAGYDEGWDGGYEDGYGTGIGDGYEQGYEVGYTQGQTTGYNNGFNAGAESVNNYTFPVLFASIADTPVLIFRSLFNFDLFGTSALVVIMSIFTALIIIFIAKKIIK